MTAATLTGPDLQQHLTDVLGGLDFAFRLPGTCPACQARDDGWCDGCTAARDADETVTDAILAIRAAGTDTAAVGAYMRCWLELGRVNPGQARAALAAMRTGGKAVALTAAGGDGP